MTPDPKAREREILRAIADGAATHAKIRPRTAYETVGNVLIVCQRLARAGHVTSHLIQTSAPPGSTWRHGPRTRYYEITKAGRAALAKLESETAPESAKRSGCGGQE